jgi:hypothetical protein
VNVLETDGVRKFNHGSGGRAEWFTDDYGLERDQFNFIRPAAPLECDAISIRILPEVGYCMGVHEIRVQFEESD